MIKKLLFEEPETGINAILGKYAFDNHRDDILKRKKEPNTAIEGEIEKSIEKYISWNNPKTLSTFAPILLDLIKSGLYRPILDPNIGNDTIYRVLNFKNIQSAKEAFPSILDRISGNDSDQKITYELGPGTIWPVRTNISGWTTDLDVILKQSSSKTNFEGKSLVLIFKAKISNNEGNFFGSPGKLGLIAGAENEMETIGYGAIIYDNLTVIVPKYFT